MDEAIAIIHRLANERFFGALTLKFEAGTVVFLKKEETIKPITNPCRNSRGDALDQSRH
jgi:hypothetical protein